MTEERAEKLKSEVVDKLTDFDKRYSYVICVSIIVTFIALYCHISSNGIIFREFIDSNENGVENFTFILGCMMVLMQLSGIVASILLKYFALRRIAIWCTIIYVLTWFSLYYADSMIHIFFAYGLSIPLTTGILTTLCFAVFNSYFIENRNFVMSCCQIFVGGATTAFPLLAQYLISEHGFKISILTISGLFSMSIVAMFCMQPVGWRTKKQLTYENVEQNEKKQVQFSEDEYKLIEDKTKIEETKPMNAEHTSFTTKIVKYFDLALFKDIYFVNLIVFEALVLSCDSIFITVYTQRFKNIGFDLMQTARCTAVLNGTDLFARLFLAVINNQWKLCSRDLFFYGIITEGILYALYVSTTSYTKILALSSLMGFFRPFLHLMMPLICADYNEEKFTVIFGLMNVTAAIFNLLAIPFIRTLQTMFNGFNEIMYVISLLMLLAALSWTVELWYKGKRSFKK